MAVEEKKRILSSYDQLGGDLYSLRYREEQEVKYDRVFSHIELKLGELVLDDGCGSGMLMDRLASPTVGLDISAELLRTARSNLKMLHYIVQGDAEKLPFRDGIFNAAISITLIQNTPSPRDVFSEVKRVTKLGGIIAITALKHAYTSKEFTKLLSETGFGSIDLVASEESQDWFAYGTR